jgi:hypothetical protein
MTMTPKALAGADRTTKIMLRFLKVSCGRKKFKNLKLAETLLPEDQINTEKVADLVDDYITKCGFSPMDALKYTWEVHSDDMTEQAKHDTARVLDEWIDEWIIWRRGLGIDTWKSHLTPSDCRFLEAMKVKWDGPAGAGGV